MKRIFLFWNVLPLLFLVSLVSFSVDAAEQTVTNTNDSGAGSFRQVVSDADPGDTIVFAPALDGATIRLTSGQVVIGKNLTIDGAAFTDQVVISGDATGNGVSTDDSRVFQILVGVVVTMNHLVIEGGKAGDGQHLEFEPHGENGGAIHNRGALTLFHCDISNNRAGNGFDAPDNGMEDFAGGGGSGGAIYNDTGATLTIDHCRLSGNRSGDGGARGDSLDDGGPGGFGGAIYSGGNLFIGNSALINNATGAGSNGSVGGGQGGASGSGGAVYNDGPMTMQNTTVSGNQTDDVGQSGGSGGGIDNNDNATIENCTIYGNACGDGGVGPGGGTGGSGGGIAHSNAGGATLTLSNTVIADNSVGAVGGPGGLTGTGPDVRLTRPTVNLVLRGVNFIGNNLDVEPEFPVGQPNANGDFAGTDFATLDPMLGVLALNGGLTENHLPLGGSLLIDPVGGDVVPALRRDQRDLPRIAGTTVDIGSVEIEGLIIEPPAETAAPIMVTKRKVKTRKNRAKLRVFVISELATSLRAKAKARAKAKVRGGAPNYRVKVKKIRRRTTRVKLFATDSQGRLASRTVKIKMKR